MTARRFYAVCGTQRVGSTLLCETLATSDRAGAPREPFFPASERACAPGLGLPADVPDYGEYLRRTVLQDTSGGVFGFKIMWNHLGHFLDRLGEVVDEAVPERRLGAAFPGLRALHLTRRDKVSLAVSQWRAERTGQWSLPTGADPDDPGVPLDLERVDGFHRLAHDAERGWPHVLRRAGVPYRTLHYEDLALDPLGTVRAVASFLGVPVDGLRLPDMQTQRDHRSERWRRAWWSSRSCDECPPPRGLSNVLGQPPSPGTNPNVATG